MANRTLCRVRAERGAIAFLALCLSLLLATAACRRRTEPSMSSLLAELPSRPAEGRLYGDLAYRPFRPAAATPSGPEHISLRERAAFSHLARNVELRLARTPSSDALADAATLQLLGGKPERAVSNLKAGLHLSPRHARSLNDLAVAYFELWRQERRPLDLLQAIQHAGKAVRLRPESPEAWFNLGLFASHLHLRHTATNAFSKVLEIEPAGAWEVEAHERLRRSRGARPVDSWETSRRLLLEASMVPEQGSLELLVNRFPTRVREVAEENLLQSWATSVEGGDRTAAEAVLRRIEQVAHELATRRGDLLLADGVRTIRRSPAERLRALARAHRLFAQGMASYHDQRFLVAEEELFKAEATFSGTDSPYGQVAALYRSICLYYRDVKGARSLFRTIASSVPASRYPSLAGRALWMLGTADMAQFRFQEAIHSFESMRSLMQRSSDPDQAAMADILLAEAYELRGEVERGWNQRFRGLGPIIDWGAPRRRHSALQEAAQALVRRDQKDLALVLLDEVIVNARVWGQPLAAAEAYGQRSRVRVALGDARGALADARLALRAAAQMPPGDLRDRTRGSALISAGMALVSAAPHQARRALHTGRSLQQRGGWEVDQLIFLNTMAQVQKTLGNQAAAEKFLLAAVDSYEALRRGTLDPRSRIPVFRHAQATFDQLIGLALVSLAAEPGKAFDAAEQARGRYLLDAWMNGAATSPPSAVQPVKSTDLTKELPAGVTLVTFAQLPDRVVGWVAGEGPMRGLALAHTAAAALDLRVDAFVEALEEGDDESARRVGTELYELLIRPLDLHLGGDRRIVLVPERALQRIPFAALFDKETGRYLIEQATISVAPSATLAIAAIRRRRDADPRPASALIVGEPDISTTAFPYLPALPAVREEIRSIMRLYPSARVLRGKRATAAEMLTALPQHDVLHFAGHAVSLEAGLGGTFLLLTPGPGDNGALSIDLLRGAPLAGAQVVVLAACRSFSGFGGDREGPAGVAGAFFAAGAPAVIAALWQVKDGSSPHLMRKLHQRLAAGEAPVPAWRGVMLDSLRDPNPSYRSPSHWAAYAVLGF